MKLPNFGKPKHPVIFILSGVAAFVTAAAIVSTVFGALGAYDAQRKATSPKAKASASASASAQVLSIIEKHFGELPFPQASGDDLNPPAGTKNPPLLSIGREGGLGVSKSTSIPISGPGIDRQWGAAYEKKLPGAPIEISVTGKTVRLYGAHFGANSIEMQVDRPFLLEESPENIYRISAKGLIWSIRTTDAVSIKRPVS